VVGSEPEKAKKYLLQQRRLDKLCIILPCILDQISEGKRSGTENPIRSGGAESSIKKETNGDNDPIDDIEEEEKEWPKQTDNHHQLKEGF